MKTEVSREVHGDFLIIRYEDDTTKRIRLESAQEDIVADPSVDCKDRPSGHIFPEVS